MSELAEPRGEAALEPARASAAGRGRRPGAGTRTSSRFATCASTSRSEGASCCAPWARCRRWTA